MAYLVGSGATTDDFIEALWDFAEDNGWTISASSSIVGKRLYMSKDKCRICFNWGTAEISDYSTLPATDLNVGWISSVLCKTIGTGPNFFTFAGSSKSAGSYDTLNADPGVAGRVLTTHVQGPFINWFFFTNATGDYIHAIMQTGADTYRYLFFGNVDKGGLTHSGAAYVISDGSEMVTRDQSKATYPLPTASQVFYNDARNHPFLSFRGTFLDNDLPAAAQMAMYVEDALPVSFVNDVAFTSYYLSSSYQPTAQTVHPLLNAGNPIDYCTNSFPGSGGRLLDALVCASGPGWTNLVPMMGLPFIVVNPANNRACAVGSALDLRVINLTGLAPQNELELAGDTWKVFPVLRQEDWASQKTIEAPSTGQYGFALKLIA